jgi:expansin (peptidoglycan-binding protein)
MKRRVTLAAAALLSLIACAEQPRPGTYDQVFTRGGVLARSGYKGTLVIEPEHRFRLQMPMMSLAGQYRRSGDSIYFETGSADVRMVALRGRVVRDTLVLEQPQMGALRGMLGDDLATQRFVRRR